MTADHPDWFGAGEDASGDRGTVDFDPEGADWFDDVDHVDPTPESEPWTSSPSAPRASDTATAGAGTPATGNGSAGGSSADAASAGGPDAGDGSRTAPAGGSAGSATGGGGGRRRRSRQDDSSGGLLAWLKRLLGLN